MLCNFCGLTSGNAGFCTNCGKNLTFSPPSQAQAELAAPVGNETGAIDVRQTIQPLTKMETSLEVTPKPAARGRDPRKRRSTVLIVVLSLVGILFFGGTGTALWWLFSGSSSDKASSSDTVIPRGDYGSDAEFDKLWDECAEGAFESCDDLYLESEAGSEYERFGATCGNRAEAPGSCSLLGNNSEPFEDGAFGSDLALDLLWTECEGGNMTACDDLYLGSPLGSGYEDFGATCGGKASADGNCASRFP